MPLKGDAERREACFPDRGGGTFLRAVCRRASPQHLRAAFGLTLTLFGLANCTALVWSNERQCETDGDCLRLGERFRGGACEAGACVAPDPVWGCLDAPPGAGGAAGAAPETIRVTFRALRNDPSIALDGARVLPCRKPDVEACQPFVDAQVTDATGRATFELPRNFDGYFETTRDDVRPSLFFPGKLTRDVELTPVGGLTPDEYDELLLFLNPAGEPSDPGVAILYAKDCRGAPAAGVTFSALEAANAIPFYVVTTLPSTGATETNASGQGGLLGLPEEDLLTFAPALRQGGTKLPLASAFTRRGMLTFVVVGPTL